MKPRQAVSRESVARSVELQRRKATANWLVASDRDLRRLLAGTLSTALRDQILSHLREMPESRTRARKRRA